MKKWSYSLLLLICATYAANVSASVVLHKTRVIFPSDKREVSLRVENDNTVPVLVQTWIDDGDQSMSANIPKTPFTTVPAMFRMEANQGQSLRVIYDGSPLPQDRESVFWVNVFEIPPVNPEVKTNSLQLAFRSRIKLFYRPNQLGTPKFDELAQKIACTSKRKSGSILEISCNNPSAYHLSFSKVNVMVNNKAVPVSLDQFGMLKPFSALTTAVNVKESSSGLKLNYFLINDQGGTKEYFTSL